MRAMLSAPALGSMNNLLYHRYLKGESLYTETYASTIDSMPVEPKTPMDPVAYHWDLQETCKSLFPVFDYISSKLCQEGLSIHLIVSDQCPFVIPVWQLPPKSQVILCGIVRKACRKFHLAPSWMTALASLPKRSLPQVFEAYGADAYVVRRSMLQREVIYSSDGLTLLTIDHIYTLKQLLCTLSKREWVSTSRESCLASCVHLLHRIHSVYTGKPASAAYIERVYKEVPFRENELEEVVTEYNVRFCTASIYDVSFEPEYASINLEQEDGYCSYAAHELPDSGVPVPDRNTGRWDQLVSPLDAELSMVRAWEAVPLCPLNADNTLTSPISVTYPRVQKPSSSYNISIINRKNNSNDNPPSIPPVTTASQMVFPPPSSPPPSYPPPSPPSVREQILRRHHRSAAPFSSSSSSRPISSLTEENETDLEVPTQKISADLNTSLPPSPLKITRRPSEDATALAVAAVHSTSHNNNHSFPPTFFPPPPNLRAGATFPLLEPSLFSGDEDDHDTDECDADMTNNPDNEDRFPWQLQVLESPRSYIEVWSSRTKGALCQRCHEVLEG